MRSTIGTIELVIFKTKVNVTKQKVIDSSKLVDTILKDFDGFISRKLAVSNDGTWSDIVYWKDLKSAEYAGQEVLKNTTCQKYFSLIDEKNMQFLHLEPVVVDD